MRHGPRRAQRCAVPRYSILPFSLPCRCRLVISNTFLLPCLQSVYPALVVSSSRCQASPLADGSFSFALLAVQPACIKCCLCCYPSAQPSYGEDCKVLYCFFSIVFCNAFVSFCRSIWGSRFVLIVYLSPLHKQVFSFACLILAHFSVVLPFAQFVLCLDCF